MKNTSILILLFFITMATQAQKVNLPDRKIRILIKRSEIRGIPEAAQLNEYLKSFEHIIAKGLAEELPCVKIIAYQEVCNMMENDRERALAGEEVSLEDIAGALGCDILISLSIGKMGDAYLLTGSTMMSKNATVLDRNNSKTDIGNMMAEMEKFTSDMARELLAMEICPYKGDFTFTSTYTYDFNEKDTGLPEKDCDFERTTTVKKVKSESWTLQKVTRMQGEGNVVAFFDFNDETKTHSNCYHCQLMEGDYLLDQFEKERATTNESTTITETYNANGLANLNPEAAYEKYHAIIRIAFEKPSNTYTIKVQAISNPGKYTHKSEYRKKGCPYFKDWDNEWGGKYPVSIDRVHGPFPGNPFDKALKQSTTKTYDEKADKGKGQTVETLEFNLTR